MNEEEFQRRSLRLTEVNKVIAGLDPAIRSDAFALLRSYVGGDGPAPSAGSPAPPPSPRPPSASPAQGTEAELELIEGHETDNPGENVALAAAILYARAGRGPFQAREFTQIANRYGLIFPAQFHKSAGPMKPDGDKIFRKASDGWYITTAGERFLRATYEVSRGASPGTEN